jgi:uncharacterized protein (TIGR02001 family)
VKARDGLKDYSLAPNERGKEGTLMRSIAGALGLSFALAALPSSAAGTWGGSVALTSDYFVRGITRTDDQAALQLDLHYADSSGFLAGAFASNTQIDPGQPRDVELNGYVGFVWSGSGDWHGRLLGGYYAYPWNQLGSSYNYAEVDLDLGYQEWLDVGMSYSPDAPRYIYDRGLVGVSAESLELNLQHRVIGRLSAASGVGYDYLAGPGGTGYAYWSVGVSYDLAPLTLAVTYVDTGAGAKKLFYDEAATGRISATAIWRF